LTCSASALFECGSGTYRVALPLIVLGYTSSAQAVNIAAAIAYLPNVLLGLFVGALVDCVSKRAMMLAGLACNTIALLLLTALLLGHGSANPLVYLLTFLTGTAAYAYSNSQAALVKHIVADVNAPVIQSVFGTIATALSIVTPAIAGFAMLFTGYRYSMLLPVASLSIAMLFVILQKASIPVYRLSVNTFKEKLSSGLRQFRKSRDLQRVAVCVMLFNMASGIYAINVIILMAQTLKLSTATMGLIFGAAGVGGIIGGLCAVRARRWLGVGNLLSLVGLACAAAYTLLTFVRNVSILTVIEFSMGLLFTVFSVNVWSFRQETTPAGMICSVAGIPGAIFKVGLPVGVFAAGLIVQYSDLRFAFVLAAVAAAAASVSVVATPSLRAAA